jgi:hypothetical protein
MLVNKSGKTRTIEDIMEDTLSRTQELLHPRSVDECEKVDLLPLDQTMGEMEAEIKRLKAEIDSHKFNPAATPRETIARFQYLLRQRAKLLPPEVPSYRPPEPVRTGREECNPLNNTESTELVRR